MHYDNYNLHCVISIHALLAESDATRRILRAKLSPDFYPRSPCGERLFLLRKITITVDISIHALLAESDASNQPEQQEQRISIHALLAESDVNLKINESRYKHFYPRSPCGERRANGRTERQEQRISIHALLAESDAVVDNIVLMPGKFLSTLSLRRATTWDVIAVMTEAQSISIHALLAESDSKSAQNSGALLRI